MKKLLILFILIILTKINCQAQSSTSNLPVIPPSPEAASITKYTDMKIIEHRGMIQHQIPLYTINDGAISLPISLSYQSGGFNINESSTSVGLGWTLNAGGVITRSMKGLPDDETGILKGFLKLSSELDREYIIAGPKNQTRWNRLVAIGQGCDDSQPDIFNFNFNGFSGKFNFDWDGNIIIESEYEISVTPIQNNGNLSKIVGWLIKTPDGVTYTFQSTETTTNIKSGTNLCFLAQDGYISSWYLTEISGPYNKRKLFFEYDWYRIENHNIFKSQSKIHKIGGDSRCPGSVPGTLSYKSFDVDIGGLSIRRIYSNTSPIEINFVPGTAELMNNSQRFFALKEVKIKNRLLNKKIKQFNLEQDFSTGRLTLKSLQESGNNSTKLPPYEFLYHGSLPSRSSTKKDHWGFTNNNPNNDLIPPYYIPFGNGSFSGGTADRSPDFEGSRNGVLYKVIYPTGGYDEYTYEQNTYGKIGIYHIDEFKTERVSKSVTAYGRSSIGCVLPIETDYDTDTFTINPRPGTNINEKISVKIYGYARKHSGNYFGANKTPKALIINAQGETVRSITLNSGTINTNILLSPGDYSMIAEATWLNCDNRNSRDRAHISVSYNNILDERLYEKPIGGVRVKSFNKYDHNNDLLLSKEYEYKDDEGYSSGVISEEPNYLYDQESIITVPVAYFDLNLDCTVNVASDYHQSNLGQTVNNQLLYKSVSVIQKSNLNTDNGKTILNFTGGSGKIESAITLNTNGYELTKKENKYQAKSELTYGLNVVYKGGNIVGENNFKIDGYGINMGHIKLIEQKTTTNLDGNNHIVISEFVYNPSLRKMKNEIFYNSDKIRKKVFYYPEDYSLLDNINQNEAANYQTLVNQFRVNTPIQTELYIKTGSETEKLVSKSRIKYDSNIETSNLLKQNSLETAKGNNDLETKIVFDKYDDFGNLLQKKTVNGTVTSYIWGYNKQYPIAKIENANRTQIEALSGFGADFHTGSGGLTATQENTLRTNPNMSSAMVTTYTYDPLIGVTSITDPKGYTMTYHYDEFNRLEFIKDQDDNLVSENKYNYKN